MPQARKPRRNKLTGPGPVPVEETNLTPEERAMLPDPDWVTEDDADAIISLRRLKSEGVTPIRETLKRLGYKIRR
jgi:hypothetical protein